MNHTPAHLSLVSWNIHRGRGQDGVVNPARTADVLARETLAQPAELLILQEADEERAPHRGVLPLADMEARTGLRHLHADDHGRWGGDSHGFLGVFVMGNAGIEVEDVALLDLPGHCHRGAVILDLRREGHSFRLIATHLSLSQVLRVVQMRTLAQHLFRRQARPTILCGDLNEWRPWGGLAFSRRVLGQSFTGPAPATFPVGRPVLPLDRVLAACGARVTGAGALDGPGIRVASDHRPLRAEVAIG